VGSIVTACNLEEENVTGFLRLNIWLDIKYILIAAGLAA
jgi:hypothetical protein